MTMRFGACCFLAAVMVGTGSKAVAQPATTHPFEIYFIDVAGGAATLLVTPHRESVLIDSGWPGLNDRDPKRIVHVLHDLAGCDQLDHLVTTHWHTDHFGGVAGLARLIKIKHFWDRGLPEDADARPDFPDGPKPNDPLGIAYRSASAGKRKALKAGDSLPLEGCACACVGIRRKSDRSSLSGQGRGCRQQGRQSGVRKCSAGPISGHIRQRPEPRNSVLAGEISVFRRWRPDMERGKTACLSCRLDRTGRSLSGHAPWHGYLESSDPGEDHCARGGDHEQWTAEGGSPARSSCSRRFPRSKRPISFIVTPTRVTTTTPSPR